MNRLTPASTRAPVKVQRGNRTLPLTCPGLSVAYAMMPASASTMSVVNAMIWAGSVCDTWGDVRAGRWSELPKTAGLRQAHIASQPLPGALTTRSV